MSPDKPSRTFIGSVVCVDLVGYSTKSTAQQGAIKKLFNGLLAQALSGVPVEDRIILDTGDGAAISFLGDPEASLAVGLELRKVMCERAVDLGATSDGLQGPVRIGINLGPVKLAMDLNGYPKIIGDGINVAERIMGFAKPGQVVASRSFHDMVSRLSDGNAALFHYEGVRTDKNVRDHEIYVVEAPAEEKAGAKAAAPADVATAPVVATSPGAFTGFLQDRFKVGFAALLLAAVIAAEALLLATRTTGPERVDSAAAMPPPPASTPAPTPAVPSTPPASVPEPAPGVSATPAPATPAPKVAEAKPADTKAAAKPEPAPAPRTETKPAAPAESRVAPARETAREAEKIAAAKSAPPPAKPAPEPEKPAAAKAAAKTPAIDPQKAAPTKPPAEPPKTAARKPEEAPRPAAPPPAAPVPEAPKEEPPKPVVAAPTPTSTVTLLARAPVEFPVEAAARRIDSGTVRARVTITAAGTVSNVQILEARPRRWFDGEATRALKLFKFNPGLEGRTYEVEIEFQR